MARAQGVLELALKARRLGRRDLAAHDPQFALFFPATSTFKHGSVLNHQRRAKIEVFQ